MSTAPKMALSRTIGETTAQSVDSVATAPESGAPTQLQIAELAYRYWEARGRPVGSPEEDWFRAEQDILMERLVWGH